MKKLQWRFLTLFILPLLLCSCMGSAETGSISNGEIEIESNFADESQGDLTRLPQESSQEELAVYEDPQLREKATALGMYEKQPFWFIDLSLPPEERSWRQEIVFSDVPIDTKNANQIMWLVRTCMYSQDYPEMGTMEELEADDSGDKPSSYRLDFADDAFVPTQEYLCNLMSNCFVSTYAAVYVTAGGQAVEEIPTYGTGYADIITQALGRIKTAAEVLAEQQRPAYKSDPVRTLESRPLPYFRNEEEDYQPVKDWSDLPEELQQELTAFFLPDNPVEYRLNEFLYQVLPQGYLDYADMEFDSPENLNNRIVKRIAFRVTNRVPTIINDITDEELQRMIDNQRISSREDLLILVAPPSTDNSFYGNWNLGSVVLQEHLELSAKRVFGQDVSILHQSLGDKTWSYDDLGRFYTHFPGGTGDGYGGGGYPIVLDYRDQGSYYDVTIAFYFDYVLENWQGIDCLGEANEYGQPPRKTMTVYNAVELIQTQAPRASIRLTKGENGELFFSAFHYIGHNY